MGTLPSVVAPRRRSVATEPSRLTGGSPLGPQPGVSSVPSVRVISSIDGARVGATLLPIHPRCRCQIAPAVDDWDAWVRDQVDLRQAEIAARRVGGDEAENPLHPVPSRGSVRYGKPSGKLMPHERHGIDDLVELGYEVEAIDEDDSAPANIDLRLGDDGQLWEMKNVGDGKHSVNDRMRDAYHKWVKLVG